MVRSFEKLNLQTKLITGFSIVIIFTIIISILSFVGFEKLINNTQTMYDKDLMGISYLRQMARDTNGIARSLNRYVLSVNADDTAAAKKAIEKIEALKKNELDLYEKAKPTIIRKELKDKLDALKPEIDKYFSMVGQVINSLPSGDKAAIAGYKLIASAEYQDSVDNLLAHIKEIADMKADGAEKNLAAAVESSNQIKFSLELSLAISILASVAIVYMVSQSINKPVDSLSKSINDLADSRLETVVENQDYSNEIGKMAKAVAVLQTNLQENARIVKAQEATTKEIGNIISRAAGGDFTAAVVLEGKDGFLLEISAQVNQLIDTSRKAFQAISQNATALASSSEELAAVSVQMSNDAQKTSAQAKLVSNSAVQVSSNTQAVAAGVEEMGSSIREISINAVQASNVANQAVDIASRTNATMEKLGASSTQIGGVLKVISSIAEQTNLLALNATIEAARAGELGKGFAVVANEVKELARQTAKATQEISGSITAIQGDAKGAMDSIAEISAIINKINDISSIIASAVEEQAATTGEMSRSVSTAARSSSEIASNIVSVSEAAQSTTQGASHTQIAANELAKIASELQNLVSRFTV